MIHLDSRLQAVAEFVQGSRCTADIGTDHAYLALALLQQQRAARVIAGDKNPGPYQAACRTVREAGEESRIEVRLGDGLQILKPEEADTICIAGMGGQLISSLLQAAPEMLSAAEHLVLQPMNGAAELRGWLYRAGWRIVDESLAEAEGRIYEIISSVKGEERLPEPLQLLVGPRLLEKRPSLLKRHVGVLLERLKKAAEGMEKSRTAVESEKYRRLLQQKAELEEILKW